MKTFLAILLTLAEFIGIVLAIYLIGILGKNILSLFDYNAIWVEGLVVIIFIIFSIILLMNLVYYSWTVFIRPIVLENINRIEKLTKRIKEKTK